MTNNIINRFTIRVYGLLIDQLTQSVLLSKEQIGTFAFTKFPGGGLEFGEGTKSCLVREFKEEVNIDIEVGEHIYTTDYFQQSAFKPTDQLMAIYYWVQTKAPISEIRLDQFDIENNGRIEQQQFVWIPLTNLEPSMLTFPIDQHVVSLLKPK